MQSGRMIASISRAAKEKKQIISAPAPLEPKLNPADKPAEKLDIKEPPHLSTDSDT